MENVTLALDRIVTKWDITQQSQVEIPCIMVTQNQVLLIVKLTVHFIKIKFGKNSSPRNFSYSFRLSLPAYIPYSHFCEYPGPTTLKYYVYYSEPG
jgi:hypothetical protein